VDLLDSQGGTIRATMFNDTADKFFPILREGDVYTFSKGTLKIANKKYNRTNSEYEITLNNDAEVVPMSNDASIQAQLFDFVSIEVVNSTAQPESYVDVIGIVTEVQPVGTIIAKASGKEHTKREIKVSDASMLSVAVTLWGDSAEKYNEELLAGNPVIALSNCRVSDFGGKSLSASFSSKILVNPDRSEAHKLKQWWDAKGHSLTFESITQRGGGGSGNDPRILLSDIKEKQLGFQEKPDYFIVRSTVTLYKHSEERRPYYLACGGRPGAECQKKVVGEAGNYRCEKCDMDVAEPTARYILSLVMCDASGQTWATAFNEPGEILMQKTAKALDQYHQQKRYDEENLFFTGRLFREYMFKCRAMAEQRNEEQRLKITVVSVADINYKNECKYLLEQIAQFA
jgi:replication factor A1